MKEQVLTQKEQELAAGQTAISNAEAELATKKQQLVAGQEAYRQGFCTDRHKSDEGATTRH